jgi:hypothetical protein
MVSAISRSVQAQGVPPATNQQMQRVDELLRQMTVEEKAMQLSCVVPIAVLGREGLMRGQADKLLKQGIGDIAGPGLIGHKTPETLAKSVNAMQRYLVTETRLKIPALEYGAGFGMTVRFKTRAGDAPVLRLLWRKEGGGWRITSYGVELP